MTSKETSSITVGDLSASMYHINGNLARTALKITNFATKKKEPKFMLQVFEKGKKDNFNPIHIGSLEVIAKIIKNIENSICL